MRGYAVTGLVRGAAVGATVGLGAALVFVSSLSNQLSGPEIAGVTGLGLLGGALAGALCGLLAGLACGVIAPSLVLGVAMALPSGRLR